MATIATAFTAGCSSRRFSISTTGMFSPPPPANHKPFSRLAAFRIIADRLSKDVALEPRALDPKVAKAAEQLLGIRLPPGNHRGH